jgi:hypothetical protein
MQYVSYSNQGGLAHLFDGLKCAMLNFAPGGSRAAHVAASLQRIHLSLAAICLGDAVGVLLVEQDNS